MLDAYLLHELLIEPGDYDPNDYFDVTQHEVDRQDDLEYEEVELWRSRQQEKLGLTVCYRTDEEEDLGIYVGEVNPDSIAAMDGRIREGDRILQINGEFIQSREAAVAILTREDSTNISLLLARPDIQNDNQLDPDELDDLDTLADAVHLPPRLRSGPGPGEGGAGGGGRGVLGLQTVLSNSQELDSGVGRTDESTRNEESSEHDLLHSRDSLDFSTESLLGLDCLGGGEGGVGLDCLGGGGGGDVMMMMMMPGLTEEECERYRELLEIKCFYDNNGSAALQLLLEGGGSEVRRGGGGGGALTLDVNQNEEEGGALQQEMALLEEELRHLEFKCRNVLRAQKMQQLREHCLKKEWPLEEEEGGDGAGGGAALVSEESCHHELSDINELPERSDKDSTSAYNTGGESCRSTPLARYPSPSPSPSPARLEGGGHAPAPTLASPQPPRTAGRHRERGGRGERGGAAQPYSPNSHRRGGGGGGGVEGRYPPNPPGAKSRDGGARRGSEGGGEGAKRSPKASGGGGRSAENSPYLSRRQSASRLLLSPMQPLPPPQQGHGTMEAAPPFLPPPPPLPLALSPPASSYSPRTEWKVKVRSDGSRYVAKRPVRDRLLKARAREIREERSGTTTDDDAVSEMKMGRYWSKEERKKHLVRAREHRRRRREFMVQSRLDCLRERDQQGGGGVQGGGGAQGGEVSASIQELSHRRTVKKRSRRILDNWITIQELLAHGTHSPGGNKVYNPLLSVTTV